MEHPLKILVTGGAGYIGSHAILDLCHNGFSPVIVDNLCNSSYKNIEGLNNLLNDEIKWYDVDCTNFEKLNEVFELEGDIIACIHFAAYKSVEESISNPKKYFDNNVESLNILLKCMKANDVSNIIFSSSCTVYGIPSYLPVDENALFKEPASPYAETKQICEKILLKDSCASISLR